MKILMFSWRDLAHERAGGAEVYTHELMRAWHAAGHRVTLFTSEASGRPQHETVDGVEIVRSGNRISVYSHARRFWREAAGDGFDVVVDQVNTRPFMCPTFVQDRPVVALMYQLAHDVWFHETPWPVAVAGKYFFEPRWLRVYRNIPVLTISESSRRSMLAHGLEDVTVLPMACSEPPPVTGTKADNPTVLFVGRLASNKRPDHAVAAFRHLRRTVPEARLWMVGGGPLEERLKAENVPGVTFFGRVSEQQKYELMASAHVLIATSVREGWGMTVSEAASVGTPTIAYDVPGLHDSVGACGGELVPPDPVALGDRLALRLPEWLAEPPKCDVSDLVSWPALADLVLGELLDAATGQTP